MAVGWPPEADIARAIGRILRALGSVAWARWPDWYGEEAPFAQAGVGMAAAADFDSATVERLGARRPELNRAWALQAVARVRAGRRPLLDAFPPAVQARQLMLAMGQPEMVLLLALEDPDLSPASLLGFARAASWAAGETGARVAAFVPAIYRNAPGLDAITYGAVDFDAEPPTSGVAGGNAKRSAATNAREPSSHTLGDGEAIAIPAKGRDLPGYGARGNAGSPKGADASGTRARPGAPTAAPRPKMPRRVNDEPLRLVFPPILGRPHPSSPGEQLLAEWLARDSELAPLFAFNQRLETSSGESFIVDLLWRGGKLAVEVDGYGWHSSPYAFAADRYRDYRLVCDGFRTLRLPHDEVMDDPALQCEKIRDVVRAIRKER